MSLNTKILQIYYKPEQLETLDPAFTLYDNTDNPNPAIQEWLIWDKMYQEFVDQGVDRWGFVSWKFRDKMGISGQVALDFIDANPGHDVYLFNPAILNEAVWANGWEQGDYWHPGLADIADEFLQRTNTVDSDYLVKEMMLDRTRMGFATYFVATRKFWDGYMDLSRKIFTLAEQDPEFNQKVFGEGGSGYNLNKSLPMFPFLNERLVGTFMDLNDLDVCTYTHTANTLPEKYKPYIAEISALSDLKMAVNYYESDQIYNAWNQLRQAFLIRNNGVLNIE